MEVLQLIGWLGCAYLAVKVLEMSANPAYRDSEGRISNSAQFGIWLGWLSVFVFGIAFLMQGTEFPSIGASSSSANVQYDGADLTEIPMDPAMRDDGANDADLVEMPTDKVMDEYSADDVARRAMEAAEAAESGQRD